MEKLIQESWMLESYLVQVGCRTKWGSWSGEEIPYCTTGNQYRWWIQCWEFHEFDSGDEFDIENLVILIQGAWEKIWFSGLGWVKQDKGAHWVYQALPIQEVRIHWGKESICLWVRIFFLLSLGSVGENSGEDGATDLPPGQPCGRVWGHTRTLPGLLFYQYLG